MWESAFVVKLYDGLMGIKRIRISTLLYFVTNGNE